MHEVQAKDRPRFFLVNGQNSEDQDQRVFDVTCTEYGHGIFCKGRINKVLKTRPWENTQQDQQVHKLCTWIDTQCT